jgi:ferritin-like metal-binding protein YciE
MKRINSLSDLLMEELADLLNAENQLIEALPKMAEAGESSELKGFLEDHLEVTKEHAHRLQDIFSNIGQNPQRIACKAIKKFIEAGKDIVNTTGKSSNRDAAIIRVAQQIEHYEINGYVTAREHAEDLGHTRMVELLDKTLDEERAMNLHLSELAQSMINVQAMVPGISSQQEAQSQGLPTQKKEQGGFYIPEKKFNRGSIKKKSKGADISRFISEGNPNIQEDGEKGK